MSLPPFNQSTSDEFLNAFADGELAADERQRALTQLSEDADFKARACELHTLKEQIRGAYAELPPVQQIAPPHRASSTLPYALAASVLLAIGAAGGWLANEHYGISEIAPLTGLPVGYQALALSDRADTHKVVLHLDSGDAARFAATLDLAEQLLQKPGRRVEIVANSDGLNLLRVKTAGYDARIAHLAHLHTNLSFVACSQTIRRFQREGQRVELVPQAQVTSAAINEILSRMQQGWYYVRV